MITLRLRDYLAGERLQRDTRRYLRRLRELPVLRSREAASELLRWLRAQPGPHVRLGTTTWEETVAVPLIELVKACGLTTGGMGSGKTMFALLPIRAIIGLLPGLRTMSFGVLDAKGELFERTLYLLAVRLRELQGAEREGLLRRIVVIDFSSREAISPYNILSRWPYADPDFFVTNRLETLRELLPASDKLSLRGATVLKNVLTLLAEFGLPPTYIEPVLSDDALRHRLVIRSHDAGVRAYFQRHYAFEGKQTIAALRARMEALFASEGVRLALSGSSAPDFRQLQNEGKIVLVNCAGPSITRGVRLLLQGLVLSDIRQAIFARPIDPPVTYLWCADEAQNFFLTRQQQEDMADVLTMARSFGSFFYFLCQNLSTAIPDARILEHLHTNIRWSLTLRGSPRDAQFLRPALPVTGRVERPEPRPFHERTLYSAEEERALLLDGVAHLPDQVGYLWLKTRSREAIRLRTERVELPQGEDFRHAVAELRRLGRAGLPRRLRTGDRRARPEMAGWSRRIRTSPGPLGEDVPATGGPMASLEEKALDLALLLVASPVYAMLALRRAVRHYRFLRIAFASSLTCECGEELSLVGMWRCSCRFTYVGHLLRVCPVCGSLPCVIRCYRCGVTKKLPEPV